MEQTLHYTQSLGCRIRFEFEFSTTFIVLMRKIPLFCLGHEKIIDILIKAGADINSKGESNWRPIHFSAQNGTENAAKTLIANNADLNLTNLDGETPLCVAVEFNQLNVAKILIQAGAELEIEDDDGWTPLCRALSLSSIDGRKLQYFESI